MPLLQSVFEGACCRPPPSPIPNPCNDHNHCHNHDDPLRGLQVFKKLGMPKGMKLENLTVGHFLDVMDSVAANTAVRVSCAV